MGGPMSPERWQREQTAGVLSIGDVTELLKVSHRTGSCDISNPKRSGRVVRDQIAHRLQPLRDGTRSKTLP